MKIAHLPLLAACIAVAISPALAIEDTAFQSPSGNIHCSGWGEDRMSVIECELLSRSNTRTALPRPSDCDLEWGGRFRLNDSGRAMMICSGDTLRDDKASVLAYGRRLEYFGITCTSTEQGVECINYDGHGFKIAKARQELY